MVSTHVGSDTSLIHVIINNNIYENAIYQRFFFFNKHWIDERTKIDESTYILYMYRKENGSYPKQEYIPFAKRLQLPDTISGIVVKRSNDPIKADNPVYGVRIDACN